MENNNEVKINSLLPIGFRCLVNVPKRPTTTTSGFLLPENDNQGMPAMAQIAVLGKKTWVEKLQILLGLKPRYKIGQWVYFRKYSIDTLEIKAVEGDLTLYVLEDNEIIGLVN